MFFAILLLSGTAMFAQNNKTTRDRNQPSNDAPATVLQSFHRDNPNVNNENWSQSNNQWRANYNDDQNRNVDLYYDRNGIKGDKHTAWDNKDIPLNIDGRVNSTYHANGNYKAVRIDRPNNSALYQIKIQNGGKDRIVYLDEQGKKRKYNDHH